jgi:hypothetical protein
VRDEKVAAYWDDKKGGHMAGGKERYQALKMDVTEVA